MKNIAFLLIVFFGASSIQAFEFSDNYWESGRAVFHVGFNGSSPSGGTWNDAFIRSMAAWSEVSSFEFEVVNEYLDPCGGSSMTGVDFGDTVCGNAFGNSTLAVTTTRGLCFNPQCSNGFGITDADIVFNAGENWDIYSGALRFDNTVEFERVALHELGHALGLNHSTANSAIMRPFVSDTDSLQNDDVAGINFIYDEGASVANVTNIYGISLLAPGNSTLSGPSDSLELSGTLSSSDDQFEGESIDLYQYTFENDSSIDIQLVSQDFDPLLYFVRVSATQAPIPSHTFIDDNSGFANNARITETIQAGTYWLGVTSESGSAQGSYGFSITSNTSNPSSSFESFTSIYGVDVLVNPNPNISGSLTTSDFKFDNKFLDLIQFEVEASSSMQIDLSASSFDTTLLLVDVQDNAVGSLLLQDDDGGIGTNSRIQTTLGPGTYWLGVTSFSANEAGDYDVTIAIASP